MSKRENMTFREVGYPARDLSPRSPWLHLTDIDEALDAVSGDGDTYIFGRAQMTDRVMNEIHELERFHDFVCGTDEGISIGQLGTYKGAHIHTGLKPFPAHQLLVIGPRGAWLFEDTTDYGD